MTILPIVQKTEIICNVYKFLLVDVVCPFSISLIQKQIAKEYIYIQVKIFKYTELFFIHSYEYINI